MLVTMSDKEISRINVIQSVVEKRMRRRDAAHQLALTERQTQRLMNRFRESGTAGLVNLRRGRPGNHRLPESLKLRVLSLLHDHYSDFGPTLAAEKLRERHDIMVSVETLRKWMIADGLWVPYSRRRPRVHQPKYRRDCLGELVQIDGSAHDWFEGRAPKCCLLVFIDDATGRLMPLRFGETESAFDYMMATRKYLEQHGKPLAFYSDKHGIFRVNNGGSTTTGVTQFGRALSELGIELICANSPRAKGRVERANQTLKVRMQKANSGMQTQRVVYLLGLELRCTAGDSRETESLEVMTVGEAGRAQVQVLYWESSRPAEFTDDQIRYSYDNLTGSSGLELDGDGNVISTEEYYPYGGRRCGRHAARWKRTTKPSATQARRGMRRGFTTTVIGITSHERAAG